MTEVGAVEVNVDVLDESGTGADIVELARLARFVMARMRLHPATQMCVRLVDEATIASLNERWMDARGPTDVLAFPMDELTPGDPDDEPNEGYLGDIALCPQVAERQAAEHGHATLDEMRLLTVHGMLHLLGYDHSVPEEHATMFGLQVRLLAEWQGVCSGDSVEESLGQGGSV